MIAVFAHLGFSDTAAAPERRRAADRRSRAPRALDGRMAGPAVDRVTETYMAPRHGRAEPPWAPQQPPPSAGPLHDEASPATAITADCRTELGPAAVGSFARSSRGVALQGDLGSVWPWLGVRGRDAGVWLTSYFPTTSPSPNVELRTTRKRIHPAAASPGAGRAPDAANRRLAVIRSPLFGRRSYPLSTCWPASPPLCVIRPEGFDGDAQLHGGDKYLTAAAAVGGDRGSR